MLAGLKRYPRMKDSGVEWLGEVPEHWGVRRLGQIGTLLKGRGGSKEDEVDEGIPCVRYGDLYTTHKWVIAETRSSVSKERATEYMPMRYGDLLFAASGETADEIGKSAVNLIRSRACCGGDIILFRPRRRLDPRFMGYAADCRAAAVQKAMMGRGFTVMHMYPHQIKRVALALPPLHEQTAIARFLDHATSWIERYIRAKEKLVALLEEQKQVIVHDAVTGRIDVRTGKPYPAYKPSGVECLGDVPAHWETRRLGRIGRFFKGSGGTKADERTDGVPCIRYGDLYTQHQFYVCSSRSCVSPKLAEASYTPINYGEVLFAGSGETMNEIGKSAVNLIRTPAYCGGDVIVFRPSIDIDARFIGYAADCPAAVRQKAQMGRGFTVMHIYSSELKHLAVPLPLAREQTAIADYLDNSLANLASSIERTNCEIDLLREYRTRLIADAVTGKLDVRQTAAELQEVEPNATNVASSSEIDEGDAAPAGEANVSARIAS